jgi:hypothetical protein
MYRPITFQYVDGIGLNPWHTGEVANGKQYNLSKRYQALHFHIPTYGEINDAISTSYEIETNLPLQNQQSVWCVTQPRTALFL